MRKNISLATIGKFIRKTLSKETKKIYYFARFKNKVTRIQKGIFLIIKSCLTSLIFILFSFNFVDMPGW